MKNRLLQRKEYKFVSSNQELSNFFIFYKDSIETLHPKRTIKSLYLDTVDFQLYRDSLLNDIDKLKIRFRQYPSKDSDIYKELKVNSVNGKEKSSLKSSYKKFEDIKSERYKNFILQPSLFVEYERQYYSIEGEVRVTIDQNIRYSAPKNRSLLSKEIKSKETIIEFKLLNDKVQDIEQTFYKNPVAFSKYLVGINKIYGI